MSYVDPMVPERLAALHQDVGDLLERVAGLLASAQVDIAGGDGSQGHATLTRTISGARQSVQDLELRMAVIAPMKAGKSTIVNALVGSDLVPSRAAAMTTLPTEIVLSRSSADQEPALHIDQRDRALFRESIQRIEAELDPCNGDPDYRERMTGRYPYLTPLLASIQEDWLAEWDHLTFTGLERIRGALQAYNDVARLAAGLRAPLQLAERLHAAPRIEASHRWSRAEDTGAFGHLVLVDTPGPDEADSGLRLSDVLRKQLEKCSVILIVLDFTKLNSNAAAAIKETMEPALAAIRRDQLFAVVNKVDQRNRGDMTRDQLRDFVIHDLGLVDRNATDRIFELVAIRALQAVRCLDEIKAAEDAAPGSFDPQTSEETRELYELVHTIEAEDRLAEATAQSVRQLAEKARATSGLDDFLRQAISVLRTEAGSRVLQNALRRALSGMTELADDVDLRRSALESDREAVAAEIEQLDNDLRRIAELRDEINGTESVAVLLRSDLDKILRETEQHCLQSLQDVEVKGEPGGLFGSVKLMTRKLKPNQQSPDGDVVEFGSIGDAQIFLHALTEPVTTAMDDALKTARGAAASSFVERVDTEMERHGKRLRPILDEAHERLKAKFNVSLEVPPVELSDDIEDWAGIPFHSEPRVVEVQVEKLLWRRSALKLWLGRKLHREVRTEQQEKTFYQVSLTDVRTQLGKDLEGKITTMKEELDGYLTSELFRHVDSYYAQLNRYLQHYRDALADSLKDRERKRTELGEWVERVNRFHEELRLEITKAEDFLDGVQPIAEAHTAV